MAEKIGRYEVVRDLKSGGMARAVLCRAPAGNLVVVKVPHEDDEQLFARMRDEARVGSRVSHPHLVETLDLAEHQGRPALVVGFVPGVPLNDLRRTGPLPAASVCRIGWQIASCLHALHVTTDEQDRPFHVIHRDVSGGNILVNEAGDAVLIDLGIAQFEQGRSAHTETGSIVGTARYLAPELLDGNAYSTSSDLWALGSVLAEAALGEPLFKGSARELLLAIHHYRGPHELRLDGVEPGLRTVLERVLVVDPRSRPSVPEVEELLRASEVRLGGGGPALAELVHDCKGAPAAASPSSSPSTATVAAVFTDHSPDAGPPSRSPPTAVRPAFVVVLTLLTLLLVAASLLRAPLTQLVHGPGDPPPPISTRAPREPPSPPAELRGPLGASLALPVRGPLVVNVWLARCADCMPSFRAWRDLRAAGALRDVRLVNVSAGVPPAGFAEEYRVEESLVVDDPLAGVVKTYEIGSFTTLVFDADGKVVLRTRPDQTHFVDEVKSAWAALSGGANASVKAIDAPAPDGAADAPEAPVTMRARRMLDAMSMREKMAALEVCEVPCASPARTRADEVGSMSSAEVSSWQREVDRCVLACRPVPP